MKCPRKVSIYIVYLGFIGIFAITALIFVPVLWHQLFNLFEEFPYHAVLDACGLDCPLPLLKTKKKLNELEKGAILYITATDPGAVPDFIAFADQTAHLLTRHWEIDSEGSMIYHFLMQKG